MQTRGSKRRNKKVKQSPDNLFEYRLCIALNRTPSELRQTLTLDDYFFFMVHSAIEPLPSTKIDIAQMFIRSDIRNIMSSGKKSDLEMSWNKEPYIPLEDLPLEEQAKRAIQRVRNLRLSYDDEQKSIKKINEKLERLKSKNGD